MLKINGTEVKTPQSIDYQLSAVDASTTGRNQKGVMTRDMVAQKRKLTCSWGPLTFSELHTLLQATKSAFFNVTFDDPYEGNSVTIKMYVGDRTAPRYNNLPGTETLYKNLKMNFIEQ